MKEPREFLAAQVYSNGVQCGVTAGFCLCPRPDNEVLASRTNKSYHSEVGVALCDRATEVLRHTLPSGNNLVVDWPRRPDPDPCSETCHPSLLVWPLAKRTTLFQLRQRTTGPTGVPTNLCDHRVISLVGVREAVHHVRRGGSSPATADGFRGSGPRVASRCAWCVSFSWGRELPAFHRYAWCARHRRGSRSST